MTERKPPTISTKISFQPSSFSLGAFAHPASATLSARQRGLTAIQAGRMAEAIPLFRQALAETPDDPEIKAWLGQALCAIGDVLEGTAMLGDAGRALLGASSTAGGLAGVTGLIAQLQHWGDISSAAELARAALARAPDDGRLHQLFATACAQCNRPAEALEAGRAAVRLLPGQRGVEVMLASLEADAGLVAEARERLERLLAGGLEPRDEFRARKEMARVLDRLKFFTDAFDQAAEAGRIALRLPEYVNANGDLMLKIIHDNRIGLTAERLQRWRDHVPEDGMRAPVFVLGFFRSGTTLTGEVLGSHPETFLSDEAPLISDVIRAFDRSRPKGSSQQDALDQLDANAIATIRKDYWRRARGRFGSEIDGKLFIDKYTGNLFDVGFINRIFPDATLIHLVRDPHDVCLSSFMQLMVPTTATANLLDWRRTAEFYTATMLWWLEVSQLLTIKTLVLHYEECVADFRGAYGRVLEAIGLEWNDALHDFHRGAEGRRMASPSRGGVAQPVHGGAVARWRNYASRFDDVRDLLDPIAERLGYPPA